ncbi:MAG: hypothetical protein JW893_01785 [Candidatus Omnitrophica bacterium]|nr:hypothetical protein [Candidatus Omnitrophota bacterium]
MKTFIFVLLAMFTTSSVMMAQEDWEKVFKELEEDVQTTSTSPVTPVVTPQKAMAKTSVPIATDGELVDLGSSRAKSQIDDLERRVSDLEREIKFQDEKIRSLDRELSDLRRQTR